MLKIKFCLLSCYLTGALFAQEPRLSLEQPFGETIDRNVKIQVEHLLPFQQIELQANASDLKGISWSSHATFQANATGTVDLSSCAPVGKSSYSTPDPAGLFWSMKPTSGDPNASWKCKNDLFPIEITLYIDGDMKDCKTMTRYLKAPDVQKIDVKENGLVGSFFIPHSEKPLPVIITLNGSNGGTGENRAKLLASNGFAVLALGYFRVDGLPNNLQDIPLEYFETAFTWLKNNLTLIHHASASMVFQEERNFP